MATSPVELRIALLRGNVSITEIGHRCGVSRQHVSAVLHGRRSNPRVRHEIARAIGLPYADLWGSERSSRSVTPSVSGATSGAA